MAGAPLAYGRHAAPYPLTRDIPLFLLVAALLLVLLTLGLRRDRLGDGGAWRVIKAAK